jgi:hypothetical protein
MNVDAVPALRRERYGDCNEFLVFHGYRTLGDGHFVKGPECEDVVVLF